MVNIGPKFQDPAISELQKRLNGLNPVGIAELKVPVAEAKKATASNGLDEVFVSYKGKDYVAYGAGMNMDKLQFTQHSSFGLIPTGSHIIDEKEFNGVPIIAKQDEKNCFSDGLKGSSEKAFDNVTLTRIVGLGTLIGGGVIGALKGGFDGIVFGALLGFGTGMVSEAGGSAIVYGAKSAFPKTDLSTIKSVTK